MKPARTPSADNIRLALALVIASALLLRADRVRAQTPVNPLRPAAAGTAMFTVPTAEPRLLREIAGGEPLGDEPPSVIAPSVVPPIYGQPEPIPAPAPHFPMPPPEPMLGPSLADDSALPHLVHPWFDEPWFSHSDPNDPGRHVGLGQPLTGTSWRNRPWFFGTFVGGVLLDDLVPGRIYQNDTSFVGARLGLDFDHFWGLESRWAFARPDLANAIGAPLPASRDYFTDLSLVYYPWGDARWRPYLLAGLGFQTYRFNNDLGQRISEAAFEVPLGAGIKYFYGPWFTLRFDFADNLAVGNARISGMHNISLMMGAEFRFGGRRRSYFPWHNSTSLF
jgi:hypothetical protein